MGEQRIGGWIETYTGKEFYPYDPRANEIDIRDIAHSLSMICRFNGHTRFHYSVALHSVYCARYARLMKYDDRVQLYALLHDAAEAYICDIPSPLKPDFAGYKELESKLQNSIFKKFCLGPMADLTHDIVKGIDGVILNTEALALMPSARWAKKCGCYEITIEELQPSEAELRFLLEYTHLMRMLGLEVDKP